MVLSQIEMRSSLTPAPLASKNDKDSSLVKDKPVRRYVEGESDSSEDENIGMDVEIETGDEGGSVEDVELGGDTDEDEDGDGEGEGQGSRDESEEGEDEDEDRLELNGFVDEAEKYTEDEDEDESE